VPELIACALCGVAVQSPVTDHLPAFLFCATHSHVDIEAFFTERSETHKSEPVSVKCALCDVVVIDTSYGDGGLVACDKHTLDEIRTFSAVNRSYVQLPIGEIG
jgi:hypothetical protein